MIIQYTEIAKDIVNALNDLTDECESISEAYVIGFKELGYKSEFIQGDFKYHSNGKSHCWLEIEGTPIDLTVSQFGDYENGIIDEDFYRKYYEVKQKINGDEFTSVEEEEEV